MPRGHGKQRRSRRKGIFDPSDARHIKHSRIGVWDFYEETQPELAHIPGSSLLETYLELVNGLPYVWRMLKDIGSIRACWSLLSMYLVIECIASLLPAVSLWWILSPFFLYVECWDIIKVFLTTAQHCKALPTFTNSYLTGLIRFNLLSTTGRSIKGSSWRLLLAALLVQL